MIRVRFYGEAANNFELLSIFNSTSSTSKLEKKNSGLHRSIILHEKWIENKKGVRTWLTK